MSNILFKIISSFVKCPNCGRLKSVDHFKSDKILRADCICGTKIVHEIKNNKSK